MSDSHLMQQSRTVWESFLWNSFKIWLSIWQEKMLKKFFLSVILAQRSIKVLLEQKQNKRKQTKFPWNNLKIVHPFNRSRLNVFSIFSLASILFSGTEYFEHFCRESPKQHACEIILKSVRLLTSGICLKVSTVLALVAIMFTWTKQSEQFW